jgi:hypothetical protein
LTEGAPDVGALHLGGVVGVEGNRRCQDA